MTPELAAGHSLPVLAVVPFLLILAAIAIAPLVHAHWWEKNSNKGKLVVAIALPFAAYLIYLNGEAGILELGHAALDYLSFMALLAALYVISGGIHIRGSLSGTPLANTTMLAVGALLANFIGTTGASMVLIRPLLRANAERRDKAHLVVFFIFIVSNCGGLLTPFGDPPLFLGFLKGVPFTWTFALWKEWIVVVGILLFVFNWIDQARLNREEKKAPDSLLGELLEHKPLRIDGWTNLFFIAGIIAVVVAKGASLGTSPEPWPFGLQEGLMFAVTVVAWFTTRPSVRTANRFSFGPIVEVAVLFAGIFVTMVAPLQFLNQHGAALGVREPWHYFWASGLLSSFLDNAPTYLAFAAAAVGQFGIAVGGSGYLGEPVAKGGEAARILAAISCGAVFMGANTYIGNGPNFMVKAIAEHNGVKMPSFLGYMKWSCAILLPIFLLVSLIFFR